MTQSTNTPAVTHNPEQPSAPPPQLVQENYGRWTAEEHRLFLQGLEQHGKGWKKIATLVKTRTMVQIRTHAQKYFQKLAKAGESGAACLSDGWDGGCIASTAEAVDGGGGITIPYDPDGRPVVTMRTRGSGANEGRNVKRRRHLGAKSRCGKRSKDSVDLPTTRGTLPQTALERAL